MFLVIFIDTKKTVFIHTLWLHTFCGIFYLFYIIVCKKYKQKETIVGL